MKKRFLVALFAAVLYAGLLIGCKDLFHSADSEDDSGYTSGENATLPANYSLAQSLTWLNSNAVEGEEYTITLKNNETIAPQSLSYGGKNVSITLNGGTSERWVFLSSNGSLFTVGSGVTLTLDNNIILQGRSGNMASLVYVDHGGTFTMNGGTISGNTAFNGGGVNVNGSDGTFIMNGGTISGNTAPFGGGVYVGAMFTMNGGAISGNTASYNGGGVFVGSEGTFIKQSGGAIYGSDASSSLKNTAESDSYGHAVYVGTSPAKKRNTTAGSGVMLNSGSSGGWE
jgi:hypothetical protein